MVGPLAFDTFFVVSTYTIYYRGGGVGRFTVVGDNVHSQWGEMLGRACVRNSIYRNFEVGVVGPALGYFDRFLEAAY